MLNLIHGKRLDLRHYWFWVFEHRRWRYGPRSHPLLIEMEYNISMKNEQEIPSIYEADYVHVANAMLRGGGFLTALAHALVKGDLANQKKILETWEKEITHEWEAQYPGITEYGAFPAR